MSSSQRRHSAYTVNSRRKWVGRRKEREWVGSAGAEQVLGGELLQAHEAAALAAQVRVRVEVLVGRAVGEEVVVGLVLVQRRGRELEDLRGLERPLHLWVGAEGRCALLEQQVRAHVRRRRLPDALLVLGAA